MLKYTCPYSTKSEKYCVVSDLIATIRRIKAESVVVRSTPGLHACTHINACMDVRCARVLHECVFECCSEGLAERGCCIATFCLGGDVLASRAVLMCRCHLVLSCMHLVSFWRHTKAGGFGQQPKTGGLEQQPKTEGPAATTESREDWGNNRKHPQTP